MIGITKNIIAAFSKKTPSAQLGMTNSFYSKNKPPKTKEDTSISEYIEKTLSKSDSQAYCFKHYNFQNTLSYPMFDQLYRQSITTLSTNKNTLKIMLELIKTSNNPEIKMNYELRKNILHLSNGGISSIEAFTIDELPKDPDKLITFLEDKSNWFWQRANLHKQIIEEKLDNIQKLSQRTSTPFPAAVLLIGPIGAKKINYLKERYKLTKEDLKGVIDFQDLLEQIHQNLTIENNNSNISDSQIFQEAMLLNQLIIQKAMDHQSNKALFINLTTSSIDNITKFVNSLNSAKYYVSINDFYLPLENCLSNYLEQDSEESFPKVNFDLLTYDYTSTHNQRKELLKRTKEHHGILEYSLFQQNSKEPVIQKKNGKFDEKIPCMASYIVSKDTDLEIIRVQNQAKEEINKLNDQSTPTPENNCNFKVEEV